jgi:hypothetical protein
MGPRKKKCEFLGVLFTSHRLTGINRRPKKMMMITMLILNITNAETEACLSCVLGSGQVMETCINLQQLAFGNAKSSRRPTRFNVMWQHCKAGNCSLKPSKATAIVCFVPLAISCTGKNDSMALFGRRAWTIWKVSHSILVTSWLEAERISKNTFVSNGWTACGETILRSRLFVNCTIVPWRFLVSSILFAVLPLFITLCCLEPNPNPNPP